MPIESAIPNPARLRRGPFDLRLLIVGAAAIFVCCPTLAAPRNAPAPPAVSEADQAVLAGPWKGTWTGHNYRYEGTLALTVDTTGEVEGSINWTLRGAPSAAGAKKVGTNAVEYVRGRYYPDSGTLSLEGYNKADPNGIWELDKYLLVVSPTRQSMGGITDDHGTWTGQFLLTR